MLCLSATALTLSPLSQVQRQHSSQSNAERRNRGGGVHKPRCVCLCVNIRTQPTSGVSPYRKKLSLSLHQEKKPRVLVEGPSRVESGPLCVIALHSAGKLFCIWKSAFYNHFKLLFILLLYKARTFSFSSGNDRGSLNGTIKIHNWRHAVQISGLLHGSAKVWAGPWILFSSSFLPLGGSKVLWVWAAHHYLLLKWLITIL